jgi:hypothetical protein
LINLAKLSADWGLTLRVAPSPELALIATLWSKLELKLHLLSPL